MKLSLREFFIENHVKKDVVLLGCLFKLLQIFSELTVVVKLNKIAKNFYILKAPKP
jgi:hypothetical protein